MSIGSQIALRRKELKMSQETLGEMVNVSFQAVSAWERGIYSPETEKLQDIAKALSTSVAWLMEESSPEQQWELHDDLFHVDHMYRQVMISANALKFRESQMALILMDRYHKGQVRKGKDKVPYIHHPLLLACHALALQIADDELIATALLHDVVEDCGVKLEELDVSEPIREAVRLLSYSKLEGESEHEATVRYYEQMKSNPVAAMVKLLDRCNNISQMSCAFSKEHMAEYIRETEEFVYPLLDHVKHNYPQYYNAVFLVKYQMVAVMDSLKRLM